MPTQEEPRPDTILIVDDDPSIARLIELYLKRLGYAIVTANSGPDALALCERQSFDLAILDVMMPGMDGIELCQALRERPRSANLPIILLSALNQVQDKVRGLRAGGDDYLTKPIDLEELGARVAALLARTRRLMQARPASLGRTVGFLGARGGVGTTTLALNMASGLAQLQKSVAALELRCGYGSFAFHLRSAPRENLAHLGTLDARDIDDRQVRSRLYPCSAGFQVLYGPQTPGEYRQLPAEMIETIVQQTAALVDYMVLDLPTAPDPAMQVAAGACNLVVLVLEPDPACLHAAKAAVEMLRGWGISGSMVCAAVVNRSGLAMNLSPRDIKSHLGCEILGTVPRAAEACLTAQERGMTLVSLRAEHMATATLAEMSNRLLSEPLVGIRV